MTLRPRDKVALGIVAGVLLIAAFYFIALAPQRSKISKLDASISSQQQQLLKAQDTYREGRAARNALRHNKAQWAALRRAVPETANIPGLLRILQRSADAAHVTMQSISLNGASSPTATYSADGTATTSAAALPTTVPVSLEFSGSYVRLERLLRTLDGLVVVSGQHVRGPGPLVSVGSISLNGGSKATADFTASIYQLASSTGTATTSAVNP